VKNKNEASYVVKVFGERNTGTNLITQLIKNNVNCVMCAGTAKEFVSFFRFKSTAASRIGVLFGNDRFISRELYIDKCFDRQGPLNSWKHSATVFHSADGFKNTKIVFAIRSPASWLLALHQRPHNRTTNNRAKCFSDFLSAESECTGKHRLKQRMIKPTQLWNAKAASYLDFMELLDNAGIQYAIVKFEDLVTDQVDAMSKMFNVLDIDLDREFQPIKSSTKDSKKNYDWYKKYYGRREWLNELDELASELICEEIDWAVAERFGYFSNLEMPI
jgi:hypothetical protein